MRSLPSCNAVSSCTDDTENGTDGTHHAGITWRAGQRTGPRPATTSATQRYHAPSQLHPERLTTAAAQQSLRVQNRPVCRVMACPGFGQNYRTCRIAGVVVAQTIHALEYSLTISPPCGSLPWSISVVLVGNQIADSACVTGAPSARVASRRSSGSGWSHLRLGRCGRVERLVACGMTVRSAGGQPAERSGLVGPAWMGHGETCHPGSGAGRRLAGARLRSRACRCRSRSRWARRRRADRDWCVEGGQRVHRRLRGVCPGRRARADRSVPASTAAAGWRWDGWPRRSRSSWPACSRLCFPAMGDG
jgi:hypothetical protein